MTLELPDRAAGSPPGTPGASPSWGRETAEETVNGRLCRVYTRRRRRVADFLIDARRWPERIHAVQDDHRLTFAGHERAVARVAAWLRDRGVGRGDQVVLLARNRLELSVAFWGVHCLGAVAVLGNAWWSGPEVDHALSTAAPVLVLHDEETGTLVPPYLPAVSVAELTGLLEGDAAPGLPLPDVGEDDPAIVIFTSGSTGAAKGVILSQRSYVANMQNLLLISRRLPSELPDGHAGGVSLMTAPLFHLAGIQVISASLLTAGRLVYQSGRFRPAEVLRLIETERVTTWGAVPAMVTRVIEHEDFARRDTSSLRSIQLGGASASPAFRESVRAAFPSLKGGGAGSLYGLTEAGGLVATGTADEVAARPGSVGRLLPVVDVRIRQPDEKGEGEILVRGPGLISGYISGGPSPVDGEGWLHTGDTGHVDDDRYLYVTGRIKDIIIRGGENISCGHVEQALSSHPDVAEVSVVGLPHEQLGEQVGAVVTLARGAEISIRQLTEYASGRLGRFEVPTRWWLRRDLIPTNPQGKVVRREVQRLWLDRGAGDIAET